MKELQIKLYNALQNIEGRVISFIETSVKPTTDTHEDNSKSELYHVSSEKNVPSETESVHSYQPNQDTHAGVSNHDENTLQHIDNVHTSYSESDSRCTRKTLMYAEVVKKTSPQRPPVDEASTKEPAIANDRNTRRWVRNNDDRGQAGTNTTDSKNNNRLTNEHITIKDSVRGHKIPTIVSTRHTSDKTNAQTKVFKGKYRGRIKIYYIGAYMFCVYMPSANYFIDVYLDYLIFLGEMNAEIIHSGKGNPIVA